MRLFQFLTPMGERRVGCTLVGASSARTVQGTSTIRDLALEAHRSGRSLVDEVEARGLGSELSVAALLEEGRVLPPLDHPDPAHCIIGITGLTHLGSAKSRDDMHAKLGTDNLSDSMRMFKLGLEGGKPPAGTVGVQPEWAYKGDGTWVVAPEQPIALPSYALDGGEEAEICGLYVIGDGGEVLRLGFALGNEYSDHVMERQNYLYLAHSKLRQCSFGPELVVGDLPGTVKGSVRVTRDGHEIWSTEFISGESEMTHSISNLEHHHFKYPGFRRPGDVHVYFYGASVLSFGEIVHRPGDLTHISAPGFGEPLRNGLVRADELEPVPVKAL